MIASGHACNASAIGIVVDLIKLKGSLLCTRTAGWRITARIVKKMQCLFRFFSNIEMIDENDRREYCKKREIDPIVKKLFVAIVNHFLTVNDNVTCLP